MRKVQAGAIWGAALMAAALLAGCGPQSAEDIRAAAVEKCEIRFARAMSDPVKGTAFCTCTTDKLAESGLELTDMLGAERAKVEGIMRSCGNSAGISLPQ